MSAQEQAQAKSVKTHEAIAMSQLLREIVLRKKARTFRNRQKFLLTSMITLTLIVFTLTCFQLRYVYETVHLRNAINDNMKVNCPGCIKFRDAKGRIFQLRVEQLPVPPSGVDVADVASLAGDGITHIKMAFFTSDKNPVGKAREVILINLGQFDHHHPHDIHLEEQETSSSSSEEVGSGGRKDAPEEYSSTTEEMLTPDDRPASMDEDKEKGETETTPEVKAEIDKIYADLETKGHDAPTSSGDGSGGDDDDFAAGPEDVSTTVSDLA